MKDIEYGDRQLNGVRHTINRPYLIRKWMDKFKFNGLTTPWNVIYYDNLDSMYNIPLVKHEMEHVNQMCREGKIKFLFKYCWKWATVGYDENPYEVEARNKSMEL